MAVDVGWCVCASVFLQHIPSPVAPSRPFVGSWSGEERESFWALSADFGKDTEGLFGSAFGGYSTSSFEPDSSEVYSSSFLMGSGSDAWTGSGSGYGGSGSGSGYESGSGYGGSGSGYGWSGTGSSGA